MIDTRKREIRKKADQIRRNMRVSDFGILNLFKECELIDLKVIRYPLGENADLGFAMKKDEDIILFTNSSSRLSREIFTLAHEIGHAMLHMDEANSFVDNSSTISDYNADEIEQEANYFAACLLMPEEEIEKFFAMNLLEESKRRLTAIDIAKIMSEFNVSFEMVLNRLESVRKIDGIEKAQLDNQKNELRVRNLLKSAGGNAALNEPSNIQAIPYEYIEYVIYNYNHGAIPRETLLKVLECYNLTFDDISDRIVESEEDNTDLDDLIGGLSD